MLAGKRSGRKRQDNDASLIEPIAAESGSLILGDPRQRSGRVSIIPPNAD